MNYSNSTVIRCLGGEGNFSILKRKNFFSRVVSVVKIILKLTYMLLVRPEKIETKDLIYLCGVNQERLLSSLNLNLYGVNSQYVVIWQPRNIYNRERKPYISFRFRFYLEMGLFCLLYMFTGNKRFMAAFLIKYYRGVSDFLDTNIINVDRLICFNDQPFEAAAIILWARGKGKKTIVIQHGVILSYNYYFPSNSKEFWAWGESGRIYFKTRVKGGEYVVKGRLQKKEHEIPGNFIFPNEEAMNGVVCPSFSAYEILCLIKIASYINNDKGKRLFYLKLHPSTKFKFFFRLAASFYGLGWINYKTPIFEVAKKYDFLVTKNSSAAVDFLLLGKPVFGIDTPLSDKKIFNDSFFSEGDMKNLIYEGKLSNIREVNKNRIFFIRRCINKIYINE